MKQRGLFITGTDTDVGKTFVGSLLGGLLQQNKNYNNYHFGFLKPIASGAKRDTNNQLFSEDAREWLRLCALPLKMEQIINPICLPGNFSPKIAAQKNNTPINLSNVQSLIQNTIDTNDYTLIEGAGGITTPLANNYSFTNLINHFNHPSLLISDGRLGSINRCILTADYAKNHNISLLGIIINNFTEIEEELLNTNIIDIQLYTQLPILAALPPYSGSRNTDDLLNWGKKHINIKNILETWEAYYEK